MKDEETNGGTIVANTFTGAWFEFTDEDFGSSDKTRLSIAYSAPPDRVPADVKAEIRLGGPDGALIGEVAIPQTESWSDYRAAEVTLTQPLSGTQTVYIVLTGSTAASHPYIGNLDYVSFAE